MTDLSLLNAGKQLKEELVAEIKAQGHYFSGKLADMKVVVAREGDTLVARIYMEKYGLIIDKGVKAANIPFGDRRGDYSEFIEGLKNRFGSLESAFKIAKAMKFYDSPTPGSFAFSKNGHRTDFIGRVVASTAALDNVTKLVLDDIDNYINKQLADV